MHELAIAAAIIDSVEQEVRRHSPCQIRKVGLRIGALTDVVSEALTFGFEALTRDTSLENTELQIEWLQVYGECNSCAARFEVDRYIFICPSCESRDITVLQGNELEIAYLDIEREPEGKVPAREAEAGS